MKKSRADLTLEVSRAKAQRFSERLIGRTAEIIAETSTGGLVDGLTKNYVRVYAPDDGIELGAVVKIRIENFYRDGVSGQRVRDAAIG